MHDKAYQRFVREYLEVSSWPARKDGVPLEILDQLTAEEKNRAEDDLIKRLSENDTWPIIGLGHLRSIKAVPRLRNLLERSQGSSRAQIATALWKIAGDDEMLATVIECSNLPSTGPYGEFALIDIVYCLAQFPQEKAETRLEELARSESHLVSYNAKRALRMRANRYE
jgi:hypothetical protein